MVTDEMMIKGFEGYNVPKRIKEASTTICKTFDIKGICDPIYISNVIAFESNSGDGQGNFIKDEIYNISKLAERLQFAYGCNIKKDEINQLINILSQ